MENQQKISPLFRGAATALVTPFRDGKPDLSALSALVSRQIACGISALVILGTTGEASTLTESERDEVLALALEAANGRVPVIAGTGSNDTSRAVRYSRRARELGADGLLLVTPYYNKGTKDGIRAHFFSAAEAAGLPFLLYNVPSRTGVRLLPEDYAELTAHPLCAGIKEAGGDLASAARTVKITEGRVPLYAGNDAELLPFLSLGGDGVISVLSNLFPSETEEICRRYFAGDGRGARELFYRYLPLMDLLFAEPNPVPVKAALSLLGLCEKEMRLPLSPAAPHTEMLLCRALALLGNLPDGA